MSDFQLQFGLLTLALDFDHCLTLLFLQLSLAPVWQGLYYMSTMGGGLWDSFLIVSIDNMGKWGLIISLQ